MCIVEFPATRFEPKKDRYSKRRGAAKILELSCVSCGEPIAIYQKDGTGRLLRMYADRIMWPPDLVTTHGNADAKSVKAAGNIACMSCEEVVATPMVYAPEQRAAYHIRQGTLRSAQHEQG